MDTPLCDTSITGQKLEELLITSKEIQVNGHRLIHVDAQVVGVNQGFTSKVLRVHLKWSDHENDRLPKSIIVKVIGSNSALNDLFPDKSMDKEKMTAYMYQAHNVECEIYVTETLRSAVPMARVYATVRCTENQPGVIVLEDLSDQGIVLPMTAMAAGLTPGQLDSILDVLANVHAWSLNHVEWRPNIPPLSEFNLLEPLIESMVNMFPRSKSAYPDIFEGLDEGMIKKHINNDSYLEIFGCDPKTSYNLPTVLVHGDVHIMNMMFERNSQDQAGDELAAMLDWQLSHQGCGMEDLARLINMCIPDYLDKEKEEYILRRYIEVFNSKVDNAEYHIAYEDAKRALDVMYAYTGILWSCGVAFFQSFMDKWDLDASTKEIWMNRGLDKYKRTLSESLKLLKW